MDHLSAAGSSATRNLTTTESPKSLNRRKTVNFRFQRPHATSGSFFFNKPMRAMDSRRDFTFKKVFSGYFSELSEKANSGLRHGLRCPRLRHFDFPHLALNIPQATQIALPGAVSLCASWKCSLGFWLKIPTAATAAQPPAVLVWVGNGPG